MQETLMTLAYFEVHEQLNGKLISSLFCKICFSLSANARSKLPETIELKRPRNAQQQEVIPQTKKKVFPK